MQPPSLHALPLLPLQVAMVLFGLGMLVVAIQLVVQLACSELESLSIRGVPIISLCVDVPFATGARGWGCFVL